MEERVQIASTEAPRADHQNVSVSPTVPVLDHTASDDTSTRPQIELKASHDSSGTNGLRSTEWEQEQEKEQNQDSLLLDSVISVLLKLQQPMHGVINAKPIKNAVANYCNQFGDSSQQVCISTQPLTLLSDVSDGTVRMHTSFWQLFWIFWKVS